MDFVDSVNLQLVRVSFCESSARTHEFCESSARTHDSTVPLVS